MKSVDAVDSHVRFTAEWEGSSHHVFIPLEYLEADAGQRLSRAEAVDFVRDHLDRYRAEARSMALDRSRKADKIVTIDREEHQPS